MLRQDRIFGEGGAAMEREPRVSQGNMASIIVFRQPGMEFVQAAAELYQLAYEQARASIRPSRFERCQTISLN